MPEQEDDPKTFSVPAPGGVFFAGWAIAIIVALVATAGLVLARELWLGRQTSELAQQQAPGPHVLVAGVLKAPPTQDLKLPASIRGYDETDIYAKVPGYLKTIKVDKGDRIHTGELLAVLTSPELDQQVANARANYNLALITDKRNQLLVRSQVIPQQTADETHYTMLQYKATLEQDLADQAYEIITAPFDGIVTARYIDPGHLVPANTTPGTPGSGAIISVSPAQSLVAASASAAPAPYIWTATRCAPAYSRSLPSTARSPQSRLSARPRPGSVSKPRGSRWKWSSAATVSRARSCWLQR